jgi:Fic family protein
MARGRPSRATIYARLDSAIAELNARLGGLPSPKESEYVWSDIWHLEAHHSTALEGNTLVLREVEVLLDKGRAVGAKPLREYMEVQGYGNAARWVYAHAIDPGDWRTDALITMHEVRQVHSLAMSLAQGGRSGRGAGPAAGWCSRSGRTAGASPGRPALGLVVVGFRPAAAGNPRDRSVTWRSRSWRCRRSAAGR